MLEKFTLSDYNAVVLLIKIRGFSCSLTINKELIIRNQNIKKNYMTYILTSKTIRKLEN